MKLAGRAAVVTGAGSGIGRESARVLAAAGASVVVSDVSADGGDETVRLIEADGGEAVFVRADVSQAASVETLMQRAVESFGRLDIAVNNAGVGGALLALDRLEEAAWDQVMAVNLKGVWLCMKYAIPHMRAAGGGSIVNIASSAGLVGFRDNAVYAASKHGVIGLTRSGALECARHNIRVNAVCPGFTDTPMVTAMDDSYPNMIPATIKAIPMRRLGKPDEIAQAVLWLCTADSSFVTGHALVVDGGTTVW